MFEDFLNNLPEQSVRGITWIIDSFYGINTQYIKYTCGLVKWRIRCVSGYMMSLAEVLSKMYAVVHCLMVL